MRQIYVLPAIGGVLAAFAVTGGAPAQLAPEPRDAVKLRLLAINDLHGHLEADAPGERDSEPGGGVEYLATHLRRLRRPHTLVVGAGDLVGGSPLTSALFHDEPTIEALDLMGLSLSAVGNHEFDEGAAELGRLQRGGCRPEGCYGGDGFSGARFGYLGANVVGPRTRRPLLRPYAIRDVGGVKVGFIGLTLQGTPDVTTRSAVHGLRFLDEAETANRYARELRDDHGVRAIVVLLHEGGAQQGEHDIDDCDDFTGAAVDIVRRTTRDVDAFVTGHTHDAYACTVDGRTVSSAGSFGRALTVLDLTLDRRTRDVARVEVDNRAVTHDVERDPRLTALVERYRALAAPVAERVVGRAAAAMSRSAGSSGESPAGLLVADAQLAATREVGAVAAFVNPGSVRADVVRAGGVTYGDAFHVQPFERALVTLTLSGAQVGAMLDEQWCGQGRPQILQPSAGVTYAVDGAAAQALTGRACGSAPSPVRDLRIGGRAVVAEEGYRVTVNGFLAEGGDRFAVLREGTDRAEGTTDVHALAAYLEPSRTGEPIGAPATGRITAAG